MHTLRISRLLAFRQDRPNGPGTNATMASESLAKKLFVGGFLLATCALIAIIGEHVHTLALIPFCIVMFTAGMLIAEWLWGTIGERARNAFVFLTRNWPYLILLIGLVTMALTRLFSPERYAEILARSNPPPPRPMLVRIESNGQWTALPHANAVERCTSFGADWVLASQEAYFSAGRHFSELNGSLPVDSEGFSFWDGADETQVFTMTKTVEGDGTIITRTELSDATESAYYAICIDTAR